MAYFLNCVSNDRQFQPIFEANLSHDFSKNFTPKSG